MTSPTPLPPPSLADLIDTLDATARDLHNALLTDTAGSNITRLLLSTRVDALIDRLDIALFGFSEDQTSIAWPDV